MLKGFIYKGFSLISVDKSTKFSAFDAQKRPRVTASPRPRVLPLPTNFFSKP